MQELIKIEKQIIGAEELNAVNARDLHSGLEIKKEFATWIKTQINRAGLQENVDYVVSTVSSSGGRPQKNYYLTTDASKHIAMMSQGVKAQEVRNYFISIEKQMMLSAGCNNQELMSLIKSQAKMMEKLSDVIYAMTDRVEDNMNEVCMWVYSIDESLHSVNISDTLSATMLDEVKKLINIRTKALSKKHNIPPADMSRLIYGKLNSKFGVDTYYKIYYSDFNKVVFFLQRLELNTNLTEV